MIMQWWNNAEMEKELRNMEYVNLITWFSFEIHICAAFCSNRIFVEIVHFFSHSHYSHRSSFTSYWHGYGGIVSLMKRNEFKPKHRKCSLWNETRVKSIQTSWQTDVTSIVWHWAIIIVGWCKIELCIRTYARKWNNLNMTTGMNILWNGNSTKYYKENVSSRSSIGKKKAMVPSNLVIFWERGYKLLHLTEENRLSFMLILYFWNERTQENDSSSVDVIDLKWLFHGFDYFRFSLSFIKAKCCATFHVYTLLYGLLFILALWKSLLRINTIFTLTFWSFADTEKLIDKSVSIRLTYHGIGWSISKVSIFIYLFSFLPPV